MQRNYNKVINIFDGNSIRVDFTAGSDELAVFSFSGFKSFQEINPRYGEKFLNSLGASVVYFIAKQDHWWQSREMEEAILRANEITNHINNRVAYGQSMGGFGAVIFSKRLKARYFATAPQLTVNHNRAPLHRVWKSCIDKQCIYYDDIEESVKNGEGVLIFDPLDFIDSSHAKLIKDSPGKHLRLLFPFSTHYVPRALSDQGLLRNISTEFLLHGGNEERILYLRRSIRSNRLMSKTYLDGILNSLKLSGRRNYLNLIKNYIIKNIYNNYGDCKYKELLKILFSFDDANKFAITKHCKNINYCRAVNDILSDMEFGFSFESTGNDPQFIVGISRDINDVRKLEITMNSSVDGRAVIYWPDIGNQYSRDRSKIQLVKKGSNKLIFDLSGKKIGRTIRFDPLECAAKFELLKIVAS